MRRRRALRVLGSAAAAPVFLPAGAGDLFALGVDVRRAWPDGRALEALTPAQARTVTAVAEVILPRTDTPGATDAGVVDFIDVLAAGWLDDDERERLFEGLAEIERRARDREGRPFDECGLESRIAIVGALDAEADAERRTAADDAPRPWFAELKRFVLAGYFTSEPAMRALGVRTVHRAFEGCALLDEFAAGRGG